MLPLVDRAIAYPNQRTQTSCGQSAYSSAIASTRVNPAIAIANRPKNLLNVNKIALSAVGNFCTVINKPRK